MASPTRDVRLKVAGSSPLANELVWSALAIAAVAAWILVGLNGWDYYTTPLRIRGYHRAHALLKPSGQVGHALGVCGLLMMFVPVIYSVRKKWKRVRKLGAMQTWLKVHIFCGVVGPVLVTFHTAAKFNGIISVAYWSMVIVMVSGFVGRYLYVRIPKSIRGVEMGFDEIIERAAELKVRLMATGLSTALLDRLDAFERAVVPDPARLSVAGYVFEHARIRHGLRRLRHEMQAAGTEVELADAALGLTRERAMLLGRLAYLHKTKQFFGAWHVLHQPLVYVMFVIAALHVGLAIYLGYIPFWRGR